MTVRKHRFIKRKKASYGLWFLWPPLILLTGLSIGYIWFLIEVSKPAADTTTRTDAIVVLTGGGGRISAGVALLQAHLADTLFISGVNPAVENSELEYLHRQDPALSACCITVGHLATDTIGNAAETKAWMQARHYTSLRLVTADYHMPRALTDFRLEMPGVTMIANPVQATPNKGRFLFHEYLKYIAAVLRFELIICERLFS